MARNLRRRRASARLASVQTLETRRVLSVSVQLVADLETGVAEEPQVQDVTFGDSAAWFAAFTESSGKELWTTDGSPEGTALVRDILPGPEFSSVAQITAVDDSAFFAANFSGTVDAAGRPIPVLWRTDGSAAATVPVRWPNGEPVVSPTGLAAVGDQLGFWAESPGQPGQRLYRLARDAGANPEEVPVAGLQYANGFTVSAWSSENAALFLHPHLGLVGYSAVPETAELLGEWHEIWDVQAVGEHLIFRGQQTRFDSGEFRISDGTASGSRALPIPFHTLSETIVRRGDGTLAFLVQNPDRSRELWVSDESAAGTSWQFDIPGAGRHAPQPGDRYAVGVDGGRIAFLAEGDLWITDGSVGGTVKLTDYPDLQPRRSDLIPLGTSVLLPADDHTSSDRRTAWYRVDAADASVHRLGLHDPQIGLAYAEFLGSGRFAILRASYTTGGELWVSDGETPFRPLGEINPSNGGSYPSEFTHSDDLLFYQASGGSDSLVQSDRWLTTRRESGLLFDSTIVPTASGPVYAFNSVHGITVRRHENASWVPLRTLAAHANTTAAQPLDVVGDQLFYQARQGSRFEMWVTDGTATGTRVLRTVEGQPVEPLAAAAVDDQHLAFLQSTTPGSDRMTLWVTDGTQNGTRAVSPGTTFARPSVATPADRALHAPLGRLTFKAGRSEIWATDGTDAGTRLVFNGAGAIAIVASSESFTFFSQRVGDAEEFWRTDGTTADTVRLGTLPANARANAVGVDQRLFVTGRRELWVLSEPDGEALRLKDLPRTDGPYGRETQLTSEFGRLFFATADPVAGPVLWTSDGTVAGTVMLTDTAGNPPVFLDLTFRTPGQVIGFHGALYFAGVTDEHGAEPMRLVSDVVDGEPGLLRIAGHSQHPQLMWRDVFGAARYDIEIIALDDSPPAAQYFTSDTSRWLVPAAFHDQSIRVRVRGIAADGTPGSWNAAPLAVRLSSRRTFQVASAADGSDRPVLRWISPAGRPRTEIWISDLDSRQRVVLTSVEAERTEYGVSELPPSRYAVWIRSLGFGGPSAWSEVQTFTILAEPPASVAADVTDEGRLTVTWDPVEAATDYEILVARSDGSETIRRQDGIGPRTDWTFFEPLDSGRYTVVVTARRPGRAHSRPSEPLEFLVRRPPVPAFDGSRMTWSAVAETVGYEVVVENSGTGETLLEQSVTGTEVTLEEPAGPGRYEIRIRSRYDDGSTSVWAVLRHEIFHEPVHILGGDRTTVDATPFLEWESPAGVRTLEVVVQTEGSGDPVYAARGISENSHRIPLRLPHGAYRVWVRSHHTDMSRSRWGPGVAITIGTPPVLTAAGRQLQWTGILGATRYEVEVHIEDPSAGRYRRLLLQSVFGSRTLNLPDTASGRLRAWIRAVRDEAGDSYTSRWSDVLLLTLP